MWYNAAVRTPTGAAQDFCSMLEGLLPRTYVAIDLETTGLSAERDAIIEVGAVKFRDGEIVDEFGSLVNPGRPIPPEITMITGIADRDVANAPRFSHVANDFMRFVGGSPVVGHNVGFDLGFLRGQGLLTENVGLDSWELATILLPSLPGYSLGALAERFDIRSPSQHRALDDARATGKLFALLCDEAARLPQAVLLEINRLTAGSDWPPAVVFGEALTTLGILRVPREEIPLPEIAPASPLYQPWRMPEPLTAAEAPDPVDVEELADILQPGGALSQAFPGYEYRPPQVEMMQAVAEAFNQGHHLLAEAGTGTGKSLAYLLPALAFAVRNNERVVISTNTINLQDQLFKKDLPDLQRVVARNLSDEPEDIPFPRFDPNREGFRAVLLKGRSNYLCPRRFSALKARPNLSHDELRGITRILAWLPRTKTGDQSELSLPLPSDRFVWSQVSAENEGCGLTRCQSEMNGRCFFYRVRKAAEAAHVIVVNHALLMADIATDNRVLPEYRRLIVDEAHHLEDAVTDQLSFKVDAFAMRQLFYVLYSQPGTTAVARASAGRMRTGGRAAPVAASAAARASGLLPELLTLLRASLPDADFNRFREPIIRLHGDVEAVYARLDNFWEVLDDFVQEMVPRGQTNEYDLRLRVTSATRSQPLWVDIEVAWDNLGIVWSTLIKHLEDLKDDLARPAANREDLASLHEEFSGAILQLVEMHAQMETWVMKPDTGNVYWMEVSTGERQGKRVTLRSAPLNVGPLVQSHILFKNETVVLTSATLRTAGTFDYLRERLSAHDADTATVGSPFDYKACTLLYLPADLPEPNAPGYQTAVEQTLIGLAKALDGRTLALFTSYAQLRRTAQAIMPALTQAGITVLSQASGGSRHQMLETFKANDRTVLLGTRSFWEGVDVVGSALSALVLVRLPFAVPTDPIVAARSETFDDPFYNYQVPEAILRFRQGFGRLIRSKTDRGVVVVLDKRLTSKSYGHLFLDSLPECTVHKGPLMNLPAAAKAWVDDATG
jgi:ATP-dependent DNA helicase DinG